MGSNNHPHPRQPPPLAPARAVETGSNNYDGIPNHRREHLLTGWKRGATTTTGQTGQERQDDGADEPRITIPQVSPKPLTSPTPMQPPPNPLHPPILNNPRSASSPPSHCSWGWIADRTTRGTANAVEFFFPFFLIFVFLIQCYTSRRDEPLGVFFFFFLSVHFH
jgi:hypothetical protein